MGVFRKVYNQFILKYNHLAVRKFTEVFPSFQGGRTFEVVFCDWSGGKLRLYVPNNFIRGIVAEKVKEIKEISDASEIEIVIVPETEKKITEEKLEPPPLKKTGVIIGENLSHEMSPANFVVASNNEKAVRAVEYVVEEKGGLSVTIYGLPGVGKTHLLHATGWRQVYNGKNVAYFRAPYLITLISDAFKNRTSSFLEAELVSSTHVLLIDDFQHFNNPKLSSVRAFLFGIIDAVLAKGGKVIVTSDVKPEREVWRHIEERIRQRISLYGAVSISSPDEDFVVEFLKARFEKMGIECTEEACCIASRVNFSNVRELEKIVWNIASKGVEKVTSDEMYVVLAEVLKEEADEKSTLLRIWRKLLDSFFDPMDVNAILQGDRLPSDLRKRTNTTKRAFSRALREKGFTLSEIAKFFEVSPMAVSKWLKESDESMLYKAALTKARKLLEKTT